MDNPFDKHLEINKFSADVRESAVFVTDTLNIAWLSAQSVFEDTATPEIAIAIYDRIAARIQAQSSLS